MVHATCSLILTLKAPQLQHQGAALQVVEQTLGGVEGGEVNPVGQLRVDVVPHSRREQTPCAVKQPEPDTVEVNRNTINSSQSRLSWFLQTSHPIWAPLLCSSLIQRRPQHCFRTSWKSSRPPSSSEGSIRMSSSPKGLRGQKDDSERSPDVLRIVIECMCVCVIQSWGGAGDQLCLYNTLIGPLRAHHLHPETIDGSPRCPQLPRKCQHFCMCV